MFKSSKARVRALVYGSIALLVAIAVGGVVFFQYQGARPTVAAPIVQTLEQSTIGQTAAQVTKTDATISTMVAPGTSDWWTTINRFVPAWSLGPKWSKLQYKPSSMGLVFYRSKTLPQSQIFATPLMMLEFSSTAQAKAESAAIYNGELASDHYHSLVMGKTLLIFPTSVFSDVDFRNTTKQLNLEAAPTPKKGYWTVYGDTLGSYLKTAQGTKNNDFYVKAVKALGFDTTQQHVNWSSSSTDGSTWQGQLTLNNSATRDFWSASALTTTGFYDLLASTVEKDVDATPETQSPGAKNPFNGTGSYFYLIYYKQAQIANYFAISTDSQKVGTMTDLKSSKATQVKLAAKNTVTYTLDPNVWFNVMANPDSSQVWHLFDYKQAQLTFNTKDPSLLTIKLTD